MKDKLAPKFALLLDFLLLDLLVVIVLMQNDRLKCIAKEADLTCQLLRCGADPVDDYLIDQSREIRTCALGLMNCTSDNSVAASAVLLVSACLKKTT